jgi:hypothetical protein
MHHQQNKKMKTFRLISNPYRYKTTKTRVRYYYHFCKLVLTASQKRQADYSLYNDNVIVIKVLLINGTPCCIYLSLYY